MAMVSGAYPPRLGRTAWPGSIRQWDSRQPANHLPKRLSNRQHFPHGKAAGDNGRLTALTSGSDLDGNAVHNGNARHRSNTSCNTTASYNSHDRNNGDKTDHRRPRQAVSWVRRVRGRGGQERCPALWPEHRDPASKK